MKLLWVAFLSAASAAHGASELVSLNDGAKLVARYETNAAPMKPYMMELFSPSGVQVTVDSPPDHFHHHGLMFAIGAGDVDFWSEKPFEKFGKQLPRAGETKIFTNGLTQKLDWIAPNGTPLLAESRGVRLQAALPGGPNILTWFSVLAPSGNAAAHLWGSHYFGLGIRFPADMDAKATFITPEGTSAGRVVRSDETLRAAAWCAASGTIGGKPVTIAMWDGPQNPRRAVWFTMTKPFSYLSATLNLEAEPLDLKSGDKLVLRYGVAVFDGVADAAQIEKARATWLAAEGQSQTEN
ncbi:MAG: DUF6807 family protein [bacterium]